ASARWAPTEVRLTATVVLAFTFEFRFSTRGGLTLKSRIERLGDHRRCLVEMGDHKIGTEVGDRPWRVAEADGDDRHPRRPRGEDIGLAVADHDRAGNVVLHALHHLTAGGGIQAAAPTDLRAWRGTL